MTSPTQTSRLWTIADVADYLQVPVSSIYKMTGPKSALRIPHVRLAGRLRFRQSDIDEWLEVLAVSDVEVIKAIRQRIRRMSDGNNSQAPPAGR